MTEDLKKEIIDLLDNVTYWDTCPESYKARIEAVKQALTIPVVVGTLFCEYCQKWVKKECDCGNKELARDETY